MTSKLCLAWPACLVAQRGIQTLDAILDANLSASLHGTFSVDTIAFNIHIKLEMQE